MNKTLYITDLDGTFLNSNSELSENSKRRLNSLLDKGVKFSLSTLRSYESIEPIFTGVDLNLPIIEINGAYITDLKTNSKLVSNTIQSELKRDIFKSIDSHKCEPVVISTKCTGRLSFRGVTNQGIDWYYNGRVAAKDPRLERFSRIEDIIDNNWVGISVIDKRDILEKLKVELEDEFPELLNINITKNIETPDYPWLTIHSKMASKKSGVKQLIDCCNFHDYRVVVFGDQPADIPMFEAAHTSVAVANAHPEVKSRADIVIGHHDDEAVLDFIEDDIKNTTLG